MEQPTVPHRPSRQGAKGPQVPEKDTELPKVPLRPIRRVTKSEIEELGNDLEDFPLPTINSITSEPDLPSETPSIPPRPVSKSPSPTKILPVAVPVIPSRPEVSKRLPEIPRRPTGNNRISRKGSENKEVAVADLKEEEAVLPVTESKNSPSVESTTDIAKEAVYFSNEAPMKVDSAEKGEAHVVPAKFDPEIIDTNPKTSLESEVSREIPNSVQGTSTSVGDIKGGLEIANEKEIPAATSESSIKGSSDYNASVKSLRSVSLEESNATSDEDEGNRTPATTEEKVSFKNDEDALSSSSAFDDDLETVQGENADAETMANDGSESEDLEQAEAKLDGLSMVENSLPKVNESTSKKISSPPEIPVSREEINCEKPSPPPKDEKMHDNVAKETKPEEFLPSIPRRPTKELSEENTHASQGAVQQPTKPQTKVPPPKPQTKVPPPKPKKLSSKIAAFQDLFNQPSPVKPLPDVPNTNADNEPKVPKRPTKFTGDRAAFALNLQGIMGRGIALPGMANPMMMHKKEDVEAEDGKEPESKELTTQVNDARRSRAKGPRGKRLPKAVLEAPKVEQTSRFTTIVQKLWTVKVQREDENKSEIVKVNKEEDKSLPRQSEEKMAFSADVEDGAVTREMKVEIEELQPEKSTHNKSELLESDNEEISSTNYVPATEDTGTCLSPVFQGTPGDEEE